MKQELLIALIALIAAALAGCQTITTTEYSWNITYENINAEQISRTEPEFSNATSAIPAAENKTALFVKTEGITCINYVCRSDACSVYYDEAPRLKESAEQLAYVCEKNYTIIKKKLNSDLKPPYKIFFKNLTDIPAAGLANGTDIYLDIGTFDDNPDNFPVLIHEMAHMFQYTPQYYFVNTSWIEEGTADYVVYWLGYRDEEYNYPHCIENETYKDGYWCAAAFLAYVERKYSPGIMGMLNSAIQDSSYNEDIFKINTGKTIDELWQECRRAICAS